MQSFLQVFYIDKFMQFNEHEKSRVFYTLFAHFGAHL